MEQSEGRWVWAMRPELNTEKQLPGKSTGHPQASVPPMRTAELGTGREAGSHPAQHRGWHGGRGMAHPDVLSKGQNPLSGWQANFYGWESTACPLFFPRVLICSDFMGKPPTAAHK